MADQQIGNVHGYAAAHTGDADSPTNLSGDNDPQASHFDSDLANISTMRTRLAAIDAGYYTAERLNEMSVNDMVYAIRVADSGNTITQ